MSTLLISLFTLILLLISAFIVLVVLMQRTSQSGGMGAALGGGAAESAFGAETNSILMKGTIYGIVAFFIVALGLYLLYQSSAADRVKEVDLTTLISAGEPETDGESTSEAGADSMTSPSATLLEGTVSEGTSPVLDQSIKVEAQALETEVEKVIETKKPAVSETEPAVN